MCIAAGSDGNGMLIESWSGGTAWTLQPTQSVVGVRNVGFNFIACASTSCDAVGYLATLGGGFATLAEHN
jgi:hypothetical protein